MNSNKETTNNSSMIGVVEGLTHKGEGVVAVEGTEPSKRYIVKHVYPRERILLAKGRSKRKQQSKTALATNVLWSPYKKIKPVCEHFGVCGGCGTQELAYEDQLSIKSEHVISLLAPLLSPKISTEDAHRGILSGTPYYYRNKVEYTFGARKWLDNVAQLTQTDIAIEHRALGFHVKGFYDKVVDLHQCVIHSSNDIRSAVHSWALSKNIEYYNSRTHLGWLRTLTVRNNTKGEYMLILSVSAEDDMLINEFVDYVSAQFEKVVSIFVVINTKNNESILELPYQHKYGEKYIVEQCGHITLKNYPEVFYQTNSELAPKLYELVCTMAKLSKRDKVLDLYCGVGSIGLFLANRVESVVGVEVVEKAVIVARENALLNAVDNISFVAGTAEKLLQDSNLAFTREKFDVIVLDPPRAGLHPHVVKYLLSAKSSRLVYVSCNPTSLARDISMLSDIYELINWHVVDMFPHTYHVETIALLRLKETGAQD